MNDSALLETLRSKVSGEIDLESEGLDRYIVYTPFMFDDGDHYVVILRREAGNWVLSDEGHTFMHLSYSGVDLSAPTRTKIIEEALTASGVTSNNGELRLVVPSEDFGNALFSFVQALARTSTVAQMTREKVASAFAEDFRELLTSIVPSGRLHWDWRNEQQDPDGHYPVDCKINSLAVPWFVFGVRNDDKCRNTTITCLMHERWGERFNSLVVFEDQQDIQRIALAQLSDIVGKQFSSLGDRPRISAYIKKEILGEVNQ